jgi:hypothetical protein
MTLAVIPKPAVLAIRATCGQRGFDKGSPAYHSDSVNGTYTACNTLCNSDSKCSSFAYSTTACLLYNTTLAQNFNPVASSSYVFNDKGCAASSQPTGGPSSAPAASGTAAPVSSSSRIPSAVVTAAPAPTSTRPAKKREADEEFTV